MNPIKAKKKMNKKMGKIDMKPFFKEQAEKGLNPFSLVTHIDGKKIKPKKYIYGVDMKTGKKTKMLASKLHKNA